MVSALSTIEELLKEACERGITHLTLYPVPSEDGKTTYWHARGSPSTGHKYVSVTDIDPVIALRGALLGLPKARLRPTPKTRDAGREPERVTATVTEPEPEPETIDTWLPHT